MTDSSKRNIHLEFLEANLQSKGSPKILLDYGIRQLQVFEAFDTDPDLSEYFMAVSRLPGLPEAGRDFAIDVSLWCSGAREYSQSHFLLDPAKHYGEKIRPLLRASREEDQGM